MNNIILYKCEKCKKDVFEKFGSGRFCSRACANARIHSDESKQKVSDTLKSKYTQYFCSICGVKLKRQRKSGFCRNCLENSLEGQKYIHLQLSNSCKGKCGGYRYGSGRGKKGIYNGYYCDSSWELAYVIYNLEHGINFKRNEELFPYEFEGKQHSYKPDFIEGDTYIEIKGYFNEQVRAKEKAFPFKLKYIDRYTIKPYLDYVIKKYGNDYIKLYNK